jgi:hypothetical protein
MDFAENIIVCILTVCGLFGLLLLIHGIGLIWEGIVDEGNRKKHGATGVIGKVVER